MRYPAAAVLVFSLYFFGRARGANLAAKARSTMLLARSIAGMADCISLRGMSVFEAVARISGDDAFLSLGFYREALGRVSGGAEIPKALSEGAVAAAARFSSGAAAVSSAFFLSLGRAGIEEEVASAERTAEKLQKLGEEALTEAMKMQRFYGSVYAIAGAAAAVLLM